MNFTLLRRPTSFTAAGLAAGLWLSLAIAPSAHAATSAPTSTASESCWFDLGTNDSVCVETGSGLLDAVAEQAGITLELPDGAIIDGEVYDSDFRTQATGESGTPASSSNVSPSATTVVATLYDDAYYGGGTLVLTAPGSCGNYSFSNLGGYGWNDRASSYRTYAGCRGTAFQNINLAGTASTTTANAPTLGSLNNQASSFRTSP